MCIDTGAHATGQLTALVLDGERHGFLATGKGAQYGNLACLEFRLEAANS
jgi:hypothetical protein